MDKEEYDEMSKLAYRYDSKKYDTDEITVIIVKLIIEKYLIKRIIRLLHIMYEETE